MVLCRSLRSPRYGDARDRHCVVAVTDDSGMAATSENSARSLVASADSGGPHRFYVALIPDYRKCACVRGRAVIVGPIRRQSALLELANRQSAMELCSTERLDCRTRFYRRN